MTFHDDTRALTRHRGLGRDHAARQVRAGRIDADFVAALALAPVICTLLALLYPVVVLAQGRPFLFASVRMRTPTHAFTLYKIRTMAARAPGDQAVLGGDGRGTVTPLGRVLRRLRIDELPQILNVLRGDIGFIGPRPPLRRYVEAYPGLYHEVLRQRPGITGLATVMLHRREAAILGACRTAAETDRTYRARCIRPKARIDGFYRRHRSFGLNVMILYWTVARLMPGASGRRRRWRGLRVGLLWFRPRPAWPRRGHVRPAPVSAR